MLLQDCCIRPPIAKLLALYDSNGVINGIENVSEWNERNSISWVNRRTRWYLFLNGSKVAQTEWSDGVTSYSQNFLGSANGSTNAKILLPLGRSGVVAWLAARKGINVAANDILQVAIEVVNGEYLPSEISNKVVLNDLEGQLPCCQNSYITKINGVTYCLVAKINNQEFCLTHTQ